jgi:hypothetical protein
MYERPCGTQDAGERGVKSFNNQRKEKTGVFLTKS